MKEIETGIKSKTMLCNLERGPIVCHFVWAIRIVVLLAVSNVRVSLSVVGLTSLSAKCLCLPNVRVGLVSDMKSVQNPITKLVMGSTKFV